MSKQLSFDEAVIKIRTVPNVSNENKLKLYGLFKQITIGNNDTRCPSIFYPTDRAKWYAWDEKRDVNVFICKGEYIELVTKLLQTP